MDSECVKAWEARCVEEQPPACLSACPLHVDVRAMMEKAREGDLSSAASIFARVVPLPAVLGRICEHPCENACRRAEAGGAVHIGAVERAAVETLREPRRVSAQRTSRGKRVAVIGAGLAGLTAAFDLAVKGHAVVVFEAEPSPLAGIRRAFGPSILPDSAIDADLATLEGMGVTLRCNSRVTGGPGPTGLAQIVACNDAVLLAMGRNVAHFFGDILELDGAGHVKSNPDTLATSQAGIFSDGLASGGFAVVAIAAGRRAASSIERFLQGASLTANRTPPSGTCLYVNVAACEAVPPVAAHDHSGRYTPQEAAREASRCFPCHCLECVRACAFLAHYKTYPKRAVREIFNNDSIVLGNRKANRMIDSCTLCGLCETLCPNDLAMGEVCLDARRSMVVRGHMPASHHEFALRDMAFSRSDLVAFARHQPEYTTGNVAFFPGCQLVASSPDQVKSIYLHLASAISGGVGLIVDCCGAPAHWAGREDLHAETVNNLRARWEGLGRPEMILACSSCLRMFSEFLSEIPASSLWVVLAKIGWPGDIQPLAGRKLAIHDPCAARATADVQSAVRDLARGLGAELRELSGAERTTCCGYGGLVEFANPGIADAIIDQRAGESEADYLTYCAMCRDNFARRGKRSLHLLDLAFPPEDGTDPAARIDPGFARRRDNRARFRRDMLRELWGECTGDPLPSDAIVVPEEVGAELERRLILAQDVVETVTAAESSGRKLRDPVSGHLIATLRIGNVTLWVEYEIGVDGPTVRHAYSHRMTVETAQ